MLEFITSQTINDFSSKNQKKGKSIGLVPTMGALHEGHLSLVNQAKNENDIVVCSIFINPTQFNNSNDLVNYPKDVEEDIKKLISVGCDAVFIPSVKEMYPKGLITIDINLLGIDKYLEGKHRPGHFDGVITIVNRLFNVVIPNRAYFGQKDFQQYCVVKSMAEQLNKDVEVIMCSTLREPDGLAMSSRNRLLTEEQRAIAPVIYRSMRNASQQTLNNNVDDLVELIKGEINAEKQISIDYVEIADKKTLQPINDWEERNEVQVFVGAFLGKARLIDNITLTRKQ